MQGSKNLVLPHLQQWNKKRKITPPGILFPGGVSVKWLIRFPGVCRPAGAVPAWAGSGAPNVKESHTRIKVVGQVGLEPTQDNPSHLQCDAIAARRLTHMVWMERFELPTNCFVGSYSILLSYIHIVVESAGLEPATLKFSVWRSTN